VSAGRRILGIRDVDHVRPERDHEVCRREMDVHAVRPATDRIDRPEDMIRDLIERCILEEEAKGLTEEELAEKIVTGEFLPCQK